jgi:hypothetical protein
MNNETVTPDFNTRQAVNFPENSNEPIPPVRGIEIVRSADLTMRFFHGPRPGRNFPICDENEDWSRRVASVSAL